MTAPLTVWVQDREVTPAAASLGAQIVPYWWDWNKFHKDLLAALARGDAPDVVELGSTWTSRLIAEGVLLDISQFATEQVNVAGRCFPRLLPYCTDPADGEHYFALPLLADVRVLFYNGEYLDEYLEEWPDALSNWPAFETMCQAVQRRLNGERSDPANARDRYVIAWPLGRDALHDVLPWIWSMGGDLVSQSGDVLLDSPRTQQALRRLARLILTGCAPLPPHQPVADLGHLQAQFLLAKRIAIIAGSLWVMREQGQHSQFKAALHPPDRVASAFVGSSNVAIVRRYGGDETAQEYQPAKDLLRSMMGVDKQIMLANLMGKLPSSIRAWQTMKDGERDAATRDLYRVFDQAISYTVERGLPNTPNLVHVEEELKTCIENIWLRVGDIRRRFQGASLDELDRHCQEAIAYELGAARQRIEPFIGSLTVQYTRREVEDLGLRPPSVFDLWLDLRSVAPRWAGDVYVQGSRNRVAGIGQPSLQVLRTLVSAPQRTVSRDELIREVWGHSPVRDHQRIREIGRKVKDLATEVQALQGSQRQVDYWKRLTNMADVCQEIKHIIGESDDYAKTLETLRKDVDNVNARLGLLHGTDPIERVRDGEDVFYRLNPEVSVCLVLPDAP